MPSILRRVGEACGGFLGIDSLTERKEELEWARVLIKLNGEDLPSTLEIGVEGEVYALSLWWEISPSLRKKQGDDRDGYGWQKGEVRGDGDTRAGLRVGEMSGVRPKVQRRTYDVMGEQVGGEGRDEFENWAHLGQVTRHSSRSTGDGPSLFGPGVGPVGLKRDFGPTMQGSSLSKGFELAAIGPVCGPSEGRAFDGLELLSHGPAIMLGGCPGPSQAQLLDTGNAACLGLKLEMEFIKCREKEVSGKKQPVLQCSMAECAIVEEALRYGSNSNLWDLRAVGSSYSSSIPLGRTPERESYDHSGEIRAYIQEGNMMKSVAAGGFTVSGEGCWDLVEVNCAAIEIQNPEWNPVQAGSQDLWGEKEINWEKSSLAKFRKLLGFSTEGLEKEILGFLSKIRKRRERIHSKGMLEKSKFERELKRLECSVKYKGSVKKNSHLKGRGGQLMIV